MTLGSRVRKSDFDERKPIMKTRTSTIAVTLLILPAGLGATASALAPVVEQDTKGPVRLVQAGGGITLRSASITSGGVVSSGGNFTAVSAVGVPIAGEASGGDFSASGGVLAPVQAMAPLAEDGLSIVCNNDGDCLNESDCIGGVCYVPKNRWLSIMPNPANGTSMIAWRVSVDLGGGNSVALGWVGAPIARAMGSGQPGPLLQSRIVSTPYYADWTTLQASLGTATNTVHIGDCDVSPQHVYHIQGILLGADIGVENNYSLPLSLPTVNKWGDVGGNTVAGVTQPPQDNVNFADVLLIVKGFQSTQTASKVWLDLEPAVPDFGSVNFPDVLRAVQGVQSLAYPYTDPCSCAGLPPCP